MFLILLLLLQDVTKRLEPFIVDYLERQVSPVIVISHLSTLQVARPLPPSFLLTFFQILYEYFLGSGDSKGKPFWALDMPVGTVIQVSWASDGILDADVLVTAGGQVWWGFSWRFMARDSVSALR